MTKKDIERIDRKTDGINTIAYMALIFGLSAILILIFNMIFNTPPQGTWECVEWEEMYNCETTKEFYRCTGKCLAHTNISVTSWDELRIECYPRCNYLKSCDCVKEQLVREVKRE